MSAYNFAVGLKITHRRLGWNMQVKTWLQRLTDESNLWFNAVKAEDEADFVEAASNYLQDALRCLEQNLVRSALSCTCAANCLTKMGAKAEAEDLYALAARIYMQNSNVAMSESIREALWSMQEAIENFVLAGNYNEAEQARNKYVALATRTNPFHRPSIAVPTIDEQKTLANSTVFSRKKKTELPKSLVDLIDRLLAESQLKLSTPKDVFDPDYVLRSIDSKGGSKLNEKSIAS
jgi:hypothetical protein